MKTYNDYTKDSSILDNVDLCLKVRVIKILREVRLVLASDVIWRIMYDSIYDMRYR